MTSKRSIGIGTPVRTLVFGWYFFFVLSVVASSQTIKLHSSFPGEHPRLLIKDREKTSFRQRICMQSVLCAQLDALQKNIDPYVNRHQSDPTWIVSRLQMYWKTKSTDVFVKGPAFAYASGEAPVPTVRYTGTRDAVTNYAAPKLEDILPYMDDPRGLYLLNRSTNAMEWTEPAKSGRVVESINRQIMGMAKTAAFLHWYTGEEKYARFAFDIFDTYMTGMYYRKEPVDLSNSHIQTLVGLSSFEVIHEDILDELTTCYDFLHSYLQQRAHQKMPLYAETFKKWADLIIKNGVPFNNWNLFEARFVALIAMVLENDHQYSDGKGAQYYLDQILNQSQLRQWSFTKLMHSGFDPQTAIWNESPGYSVNVVRDFAEFVTLFDRVLNFDLVAQLPLLQNTVLATAQYLYPNGYTVAFGDTKYGQLTTTAAEQIVLNAQKNNKGPQEALFTRYVKMIHELNGQKRAGQRSGAPGGGGLNALLAHAELALQDTISAGKLADFVSPTFYAPNVSYFVQRNGLDAQTGLMISQAGSAGNHAHANGIAMELYGKGLVLAPEMGIGTSYFQPDYAEYYSQFPAHNTVVVDGISSYPVMRSNHPFKLIEAYPASQAKEAIFPRVTYSEIYFREPETNADQNRLMSIIRTSDTTGYYVDVFRSQKREGGDKRHDYFYHNLGQQLQVADQRGNLLNLRPTEKLAFADGDLFAYDYLWDKQSIKTSSDWKATYTLHLPKREDIKMGIWMKGYPDRELFTVKAPPTKAFIGNGMIPDSIAALPIHTIVVRQNGAAWKKPFVAIYEPSSSSQPESISNVTYFTAPKNSEGFVGIRVSGKGGDHQFIFSDIEGQKEVVQEDKSFQGNYGVVSEVNSSLHYLFLGTGRKIAKGGFSITAKGENTSAALSKDREGWFITANKPVILTVPAEVLAGKTSLTVTISGKKQVLTGKPASQYGRKVLSWEIPAIPYTNIQ